MAPPSLLNCTFQTAQHGSRFPESGSCFAFQRHLSLFLNGICPAWSYSLILLTLISRILLFPFPNSKTVSFLQKSFMIFSLELKLGTPLSSLKAPIRFHFMLFMLMSWGLAMSCYLFLISLQSLRYTRWASNSCSFEQNWFCARRQVKESVTYRMKLNQHSTSISNSQGLNN